MYDYSIRVIIFFLIILLNKSCMHNITDPQKDTDTIKILNSLVKVDEEFFCQIETNQNLNQDLIKDVEMQLLFVGDDSYEYSETFELYDNGSNGDQIPNNGIFTFFVERASDVIVLPEIEPEIRKINLANSFQLHSTDTIFLETSIIIYGKKFQATAMVKTISGQITSLSEIINLDNTEIRLNINTDFLFKDRNLNDNLCIREQALSPSEENFEELWIFSEGIPLQNRVNQFEYKTLIPFKSINDCGGYGVVYFQFILKDLDTQAVLTSNIYELVIFGCGDNYCETDYENYNTCPTDCLQ